MLPLIEYDVTFNHALALGEKETCNCRVFKNTVTTTSPSLAIDTFPVSSACYATSGWMSHPRLPNSATYMCAPAAGASGTSEWALRHGRCISQQCRWVTGPKKKEKENLVFPGDGLLCILCGFTCLHNNKYLKIWPRIQKEAMMFSQNQTQNNIWLQISQFLLNIL